MTHLVAISPHLDDAAFSVGGLLAARARARDRITLVTCFTASVERPEGFALACQLDKGLAANIDYMALRRQEDVDACAVIGASAIHLPFVEAPHRGYASAAELFADRRNDDNVLVPLAEALARVVRDLAPDLVLRPLAIGNHVDHWIVRDATAAIQAPALSWEDWPYLCREGRPSPRVPALRHILTDADRRARLQMCAAYASQLGYQFGGLASLERLSAEIVEERLFHI